MNEFCAAMGICNLRHVDEEIAKRKVVAERYWALLDGILGNRLCLPPEGVKHNYAYMPVVFQDAFGATRDDVFSALAAEGIKARKYFYPLVSDYACYRGRFDSSETPVANDVASRVLTLPMYADLALEDVERICMIVRRCKR
jgi:dTDP-4-amino-4,6-dideoxygalactose transaminase